MDEKELQSAPEQDSRSIDATLRDAVVTDDPDAPVPIEDPPAPIPVPPPEPPPEPLRAR